MLKIAALFLLLLNSTFAQASGSFQLWQKGFKADSQLQARDIYVYLPPLYEQQASTYPTIYMHDGQNLFDPTRAYLGQTWQAEKTLNYLIENKVIEPVIVIALDNTSQRILDYTPSSTSQYGGGGAKLYLDMIVKTLIPRIEKEFRVNHTTDSRAIIGSSLGGLVSLYSMISHPDSFGKVAALSPSLWWDEKFMIKQLERSKFLAKKIWIDSGSLENEILNDVLLLESYLIDRISASDFKTSIQNGADHSEKYWAQRLPFILKFLFPKK